MRNTPQKRTFELANEFDYETFGTESVDVELSFVEEDKEVGINEGWVFNVLKYTTDIASKYVLDITDVYKHNELVKKTVDDRVQFIIDNTEI